MKVVNEKGKLFGVINLVDLLILVVIVLAVAAVGYKMLAKPVQEAVAPESKATVTMRVRGAMPYLVVELMRVEPGEKLIAGKDYVNGTVVKIETVPYVITTVTADGPIVESTDPLKKDVLITVESTGNPNAAIFKIGNQEVRAGRDFTFKTKRVEIIAIVETVRFDG